VLLAEANALHKATIRSRYVVDIAVGKANCVGVWHWVTVIFLNSLVTV